MKFYSPDEWLPADGLVLEPAAEIAVRSNSHALIVAGPGAGKTELLAQRACYLLQTSECQEPQKILAISFKVDAADNLAKRVEKRCGKELAQRFESRTFDSFAKQLVDRFRLAIPEKYRPNKDYDILFNLKDLKEIATGFITERNPTQPNWQYEIDFDVLNKRMTSVSLPLEDSYSDIYDWIINQLWNVLIHGKNSLKSTLSFPMISRLAELLIRTNPYIKNALRATYSHVFLDEFQDTTYIQYDLLKMAFKGSNSIITAVGDDKQRIMGWAGALPNAFEQFGNDFKALEIRLERNHRSAPRLVDIQNVLAKMIRQNTVEVNCSDKWNPDDGECQVWTFSDHISEAKHVAETLKELIKKNQIGPRDLCILVKQQEHVYAKALMAELDNLGIQARIEKEFQDLLSEEVTQFIIDFLKLATYTQAPESWQRVANLLMDVDGAAQSDNPQQILQIEYNLAGFIANLRRDLTLIIEIKEFCTKDIKRILEEILRYIGLDKFLGVFPKYARGTFLNRLLDLLAEKIFESFKKSGNWQHVLEDILGLNSIPVMTIHKSKGLEYDTVIFLGLEDNAFWSFKTQTDADLCAFFVALSRAKRQIIFTFSESREILKYGKPKVVNQLKVNISSLYQMLSNAQVEVIPFDPITVP